LFGGQAPAAFSSFGAPAAAPAGGGGGFFGGGGGVAATGAAAPAFGGGAGFGGGGFGAPLGAAFDPTPKNGEYRIGLPAGAEDISVLGYSPNGQYLASGG